MLIKRVVSCIIGSRCCQIVCSLPMSWSMLNNVEFAECNKSLVDNKSCPQTSALNWMFCTLFFVRFMFSKNKTTRSLFLSLSCVCLCCLVEKIIRFNWKFLRNFNVFFIRLNSNPICFFFIWRRTEWQIAHRRRVCNTYSNN